MEAYTSFAQVYDMFMDNVPYDEWGEYISNVFKENGIKEGVIVDLGCGTGKLSRYMAKKGYDMIGIDMSMDMLEIAMDNEEENILYLMQDMRELELFDKADGIFCACDSLNYIIEECDLLRVFENVGEYLNPDGIFVFDMNTQYKYEELLDEYTFAENRDDGSFIWENYYDREEMINEYYLTLFIKEGELFRKYSEIHYQKCYTLDTVKKLLKEAGFEIMGIYDGYTKDELKPDSDRMSVIARKL